MERCRAGIVLGTKCLTYGYNYGNPNRFHHDFILCWHSHLKCPCLAIIGTSASHAGFPVHVDPVWPVSRNCLNNLRANASLKLENLPLQTRLGKIDTMSQHVTTIFANSWIDVRWAPPTCQSVSNLHTTCRHCRTKSS